MNAYELADCLEALCRESKGSFTKDAVNMLRQQADRIADLEKLLEHSIGSDCREMRYIQEIENRDARIAELERLVSDMIYEKSSGVYDKPQTNAEPVAWWTGKYEDEGEDFMFPITKQAHIDHPQSHTHEFFPIPLYTTPQTKPLSDLDPLFYYNRGFNDALRKMIDTKPLSDEEIIDIAENLKETNQPYNINFARAIEERHGIK